MPPEAGNGCEARLWPHTARPRARRVVAVCTSAGENVPPLMVSAVPQRRGVVLRKPRRNLPRSEFKGSPEEGAPCLNLRL